MFVRLEDVVICFRFDFAIDDQQRAVLEIECCCLCHLCIAEKELVLELSPVVIQM